MRTSPQPWPIIALVASAGGVTALSSVLSALPSNLPASIIALLHIPPDRKSNLASILQRASALDVQVAHGGTVLARGSVFVAPAGRHVLITADLHIALIESGAFPPSRPSADLLLTTLAIAAGPRAIAVVLTGEGHDGATGATAVHHFGGTVVTTDATTSNSFSMPAATINRDHAVDHVIRLEALPALLVQLATAAALENQPAR